MNIKEFIESVKTFLNLNKFDKVGKKKSVKRLLEKLKAKKELLHKIPKKKLSKKAKKELKEELVIVSLHIKKGENILAELNSKEK